MKRGYTVAWSGWEAEDSAETARPGLQKAKFPIAMSDGKPIVGMSHEELSQLSCRAPSFTKELTYPAANLDTSAATLFVREHQEDRAEEALSLGLELCRRQARAHQHHAGIRYRSHL